MQIHANISGLGFIIYSPFATEHIPLGSDYLSQHFWQPTDVAKHVNACTIAAFCTGSPGSFVLNVQATPPDEAAINKAAYKVRLGIEVRNRSICIRDLYDLMSWNPDCPSSQTVIMPDGFYLITVVSSPPDSGILGDTQTVEIWFEKSVDRPAIRHEGVPMLCD